MDNDLMDFLKSPENGYFEVRQLADGTIVALGNLLFTRAIYMNMDRWGYEKRFCFEDRERANIEIAKLKSGDDEPTGYIAKR